MGLIFVEELPQVFKLGSQVLCGGAFLMPLLTLFGLWWGLFLVQFLFVLLVKLCFLQKVRLLPSFLLRKVLHVLDPVLVSDTVLVNDFAAVLLGLEYVFEDNKGIGFDSGALALDSIDI